MREALVNLFVHQDYDDARTAGQIDITEHQTKFVNAGRSLVDPVSLSEGATSQARNPLIGRALRLIGFAELAGSGLREVHTVWRQAKRRPPVIRSDEEDNTFTLTLDWRPLPDLSDSFWKSRLGVSIGLSEATTVALAAEPMGVSVHEVASSQGLTVDDAQQLLARLVTQALVQQRGDRFFLLDRYRPLVAEWRQRE